MNQISVSFKAVSFKSNKATKLLLTVKGNILNYFAQNILGKYYCNMTGLHIKKTQFNVMVLLDNDRRHFHFPKII